MERKYRDVSASLPHAQPPHYQLLPLEWYVYYNQWTYLDTALSFKAQSYIRVHAWCCTFYGFVQFFFLVYDSNMVALVSPLKFSKGIQLRHKHHEQLFEWLWGMVKTWTCNLPWTCALDVICLLLIFSLSHLNSQYWLIGLVITSVLSPQANSVWNACFHRTDVHTFSHPYFKFIFIGFSILNRTSCEVCMKLNLLTKHSGFRDFVPCDGSVLCSSVTLRGRPRSSFCTIFLRPGIV